MDLGIRDRVAIVAASSRGLGKAVAAALAAEGARVAMCSRNAAAVEAAARDIAARHGVEVLARATDVTQQDQVREFVGEVAARFGQIDICVTNAGGPPAKTFLNISAEEWQAAVELNLMSTVYLAREVLPHMQRRQWGTAGHHHLGHRQAAGGQPAAVKLGARRRGRAGQDPGQ